MGYVVECGRGTYPLAPATNSKVKHPRGHYTVIPKTLRNHPKKHSFLSEYKIHQPTQTVRSLRSLTTISHIYNLTQADQHYIKYNITQADSKPNSHLPFLTVN